MRIYGGRNLNLGYAGIGNRNWNQGKNACGVNGGARNDSAQISPQGKASGMLTNLFRQKELIEECRQSVLKRAMEKQEQGISVNIQEQLKEYDAQLEAVEEQIAKELTRQFEKELEKEEKNTYENPRTVTRQEAENERMTKVAELTNSLDQIGQMTDVKDHLDGQIRVTKAELKTDEERLVATDEKRKRLSEMESKSEDLAVMIAEKSGKVIEEQSSDRQEKVRIEPDAEEEKETRIPGRSTEEDTEEE